MRPKSTHLAALIALALGAAGQMTASKPPRPKSSKQERAPAEIVRRRAKQAAKLARRAARAGHKVPKP